MDKDGYGYDKTQNTAAKTSFHQRKNAYAMHIYIFLTTRIIWEEHSFK